MRGHHEGTHTLRKDGSWQVAVTMPDGKRAYRYTRQGASEKVALKALAALLRERDQGLGAAPDSDLGTTLRLWLDDTQRSVRPRTFADYETVVRVHLIPALGGYKARSLTPRAVSAYLTAQAAQAGSTRTVAKIRTVLSTALRWALEQGIVTRNVASLTKPPKVERYQGEVWSPEQARAFLSTTAEDREHPIWVVAFTTAMREGELLGMRWKDCDLDAGTYTVNVQLQRSGGAFVFLPPKTDSGRRTVMLPGLAVTALRSHRARQLQERFAAGIGGPYDGLMFRTVRGLPYHANVLLKRFYESSERAGLPRIRLHDARHSAATFLLSLGYTLEDVKQMLGHSTIRITSDTYSHRVSARGREVATSMDALLREAK